MEANETAVLKDPVIMSCEAPKRTRMPVDSYKAMLSIKRAETEIADIQEKYQGLLDRQTDREEWIVKVQTHIEKNGWQPSDIKAAEQRHFVEQKKAYLALAKSMGVSEADALSAD